MGTIIFTSYDFDRFQSGQTFIFINVVEGTVDIPITTLIIHNFFRNCFEFLWDFSFCLFRVYSNTISNLSRASSIDLISNSGLFQNCSCLLSGLFSSLSCPFVTSASRTQSAMLKAFRTMPFLLYISQLRDDRLMVMRRTSHSCEKRVSQL